MSKLVKLSTLAIAAMLIATLVGPAQAEVSDARYYSNQTPYGDPATTAIKTPSDPAYKMIFIENVGRHGSRSLTSNSHEVKALKVWKAAKKKKALTRVGKRFATDVAKFQAAERSIGYGNLSALGKAQWTGVGRRTADNYADFFAEMIAAGDSVRLVTSPVFRTKQSASAMQVGLQSEEPGLTYAPQTIDSTRLALPNGSTAAGRAIISKIKKSARVKAAARHVLRRLYSKKYVKKLKDPVSKALDIYDLYAHAPGMAANTRVTFAAYVPLADARMLGYVTDAENFYRYGPGVAGQNNSYIKAKPLLDDFFAQLDSRTAGGTTAAVFRLGHGETTMPFAALLKLPGSHVQTPSRQLFSYANPWRGFVVGRPAGNIEWVAYEKAGSPVIVTMRYNEAPVQFRAGCTPTEPNGYFYEVAVLKACLA